MLTRAIFVLTFLTLANLINGSPSVTLYNHNQIERSTFHFGSTIDRPDLTATRSFFENNKQTVCASGIWISYYNQTNYEYGGAFHVWVDADDCSIYSWSNGNVILSMRTAGEVGVSRLNLYADVHFSSDATQVLEDIPKNVPAFKSLLLAGNISVQIFLKENYQGLSYCVSRANEQPFTMIRDTAETIGIEPSSIKSIRFGCDSDAKVIQQ